jgi:hypothetical protein
MLAGVGDALPPGEGTAAGCVQAVNRIDTNASARGANVQFIGPLPIR